VDQPAADRGVANDVGIGLDAQGRGDGVDQARQISRAADGV